MIKKILLIVVALAVAVFGLRSCFEETTVGFIEESETVGRQPFSIKFSGSGKGLKSVQVSYIGEDKTLLLKSKQYDEGVDEDTIKVSLNPFAGIEDGPGQIKAVAESYGGPLNFGKSSATRIKNIVADLSPPKIIVLSGTENISRGGSAVVVYKVSPDSQQSGVKIGDKFFKGYKAGTEAEFPDENIRIAFFSYPYNFPEGETVLITATDSIGNRRNLPISYRLKEKIFPELNIDVTERFIRMKMVPLVNDSENVSLKETFIMINNQIRRLNNEKIDKVISLSADKIMWEGPFIRPVGALQSQFEKRKYFFEGELIDEQDHLGYDLASERKNPVRAANNGVVVFSDELGIYGNTLIIDHGMGVATLYAHLSSMIAQRGDSVLKGDKIGNTGATGLAFGDHLHFGIYIGGVPVEPLEWWDLFWVESRITKNLTEAKKEIR